MKWLWPYSWYVRMNAAEAHVQRLQDEMREMALRQTFVDIAYVNAMASVRSMIRSSVPQSEGQK